MHSDIRALVERARAGDSGAFGQLYQKYFAPIYRFVILKVRHKETAEDLTQTVFMKAFASVAKYEERGLAFSAWLYQIAKNTCLDFYKKKHDQTLPDELDFFEVVDPGQSSDQQALSRERQEALLQALSSLGEEEREVIELRFMEEKSYAEVAEILDKNEEALRAVVYRAKKILKQHLQKYYD